MSLKTFVFRGISVLWKRANWFGFIAIANASAVLEQIPYRISGTASAVDLNIGSGRFGRHSGAAYSRVGIGFPVAM
jgi:hypothetical protein